MKKIVLAASLLVGVSLYAQEKVNQKELQNIVAELESKYSQDLQIESNLTGFSKEVLIEAGFQGIYNGMPIYYHIDDMRQIYSMNADFLHNGDFENGFAVTGDGMVAYVWDGGNVLTTHRELEGRVTLVENTSLSSHATGVAGVIASTGILPAAQGLAKEVHIKSLNFQGNAGTEMAYQASLEDNKDYMISNHSYGTIVGWVQGNYGMGQGWYWYGDTSASETESHMFGSYSDYDAYLDRVLYNAPQHSAFKSSGNNHGEGPGGAVNHYVRDSSGNWIASNVFRPDDCVANNGFDCLSVSGTTAKNNIAVGAIRPLGGDNRYEVPSDVVATDFSSFGPTDDGRIKPEITAIGQGVSSPSSPGNSQYASWSGTSFSAPAATGVGVLLQQLKIIQTNGSEFLRSDMMKALLTHSAFESGSTLGPDYKFGYGLINALGAAEIILNSKRNAITENNVLSNGDSHTFTVTALGDEPLKVSIAWIDPAGVGEPINNIILNDRSPKLVNDLDVRITNGGTTYFPWKLDPENPAAAATQADNIVDNLEQVFVQNPTAGQTYTITISHKGNLETPIVPAPEVNYQNYALVITGVDAPMSVEDMNLESAISVYPNPVIDNLNIKTDENLKNTKLTVFNQLGQIVYQNDYKTFKNKESINLSSLPAGAYILYLKSDEGVISKKIIKK